jgi:hypothetical protein
LLIKEKVQKLEAIGFILVVSGKLSPDNQQKPLSKNKMMIVLMMTVMMMTKTIVNTAPWIWCILKPCQYRCSNSCITFSKLLHQKNKMERYTDSLLYRLPEGIHLLFIDSFENESTNLVHLPEGVGQILCTFFSTNQGLRTFLFKKTRSLSRRPCLAHK